MPASSSSASSAFDRFSQGQEKSENDDHETNTTKSNQDEADETPAKRFKDSNDIALQKKSSSIYDSTEKLNPSATTLDKTDNDVDKKQKKSSHASDDCGNDVNTPITSSDTFRPHQHDESDAACFSESSIPSPCMTSMLSTMHSRSDSGHGMTLKGSASFLHIPVATAEL